MRQLTIILVLGILLVMGWGIFNPQQATSPYLMASDGMTMSNTTTPQDTALPNAMEMLAMPLDFNNTLETGMDGGIAVQQEASPTPLPAEDTPMSHTISFDAKALSEAMATTEIPPYLANATEYFYTAYEYAVVYPADLQYQPCYCGCNRLGHTNNLDCYIAGRNLLTGAIIFDPHASGCGICIVITHDIARLKAEGKTAMEIRQYIDATYAKVGSSTDTPLPPLS